MTVKESLEKLRERVLILGATRSVNAMAREVGVHADVLRKWLRQDPSSNPTRETFELIEAWCDRGGRPVEQEPVNG